MPDHVLNEAVRIVAACIDASRSFGADSAVVAVDKGGHVIAAQRQDLASFAAFEAARKKATTAAALGIPTAMAAGFVAEDPIAARALHASPDMLAAPGGAPLIVENKVVGGVGVSGGHYSEDEQILERALDAVGAARPPQTEITP
ncbi:MAG: heme-binding protein [Caulobacterales bacterium]|nr:heme-binding protein [Caulobacterales bacterium]